jgi:hypothetical protein
MSSSAIVVDHAAPPSKGFATKTVVHTADKVYNPSNSRRVHYRVEVEASVPEQPERPATYVHMDMEGELRDTTVEADGVICDIDADTGTGTFKVAEPIEETVDIVVATCANLNDRVIIARRIADDNATTGTTTTTIGVDTKFEDEFAKLAATYSSYTVQHYASTTPIEQSKDLKFMSDMGADAATFYDALSEKYQRPARKMATAIAARSLRRRLADCADAPAGSECEAIDGVGVFNCDTVSSSSTNPGCQTFTDSSIPLYDEVVSFGGTNFGIELSCEECAITIGGASVYVKTTTETSLTGANADFSMGAEVEDAVIDFALLLKLTASASDDPSANDAVVIIDELVPGIGFSQDIFGASVTAGLKFVVSVTPDVDITGALSVQAGTKVVMGGSVGTTGSASIVGGDAEKSGSFELQNFMDAPRITSTLAGDLDLDFEIELQFGLWANLQDVGGAAIYAAAGMPLEVSGSLASNSEALLTTIPDSYCTTEFSDTSLFFGDCTLPNNLQVQLTAQSGDPYVRVALEFDVSGLGTFDFNERLEATGLGLTFGPFTLTYCDCIQYNGIDCTVQDSGSQCAEDDFPPKEDLKFPEYTEDSPPSGMALSANHGLNAAGSASFAVGSAAVVALHLFRGMFR